MVDYLKIAVVQPSTDNHVAWHPRNANFPYMDASEAAKTWYQIHITLSSYRSLAESSKPDIVVIPELNIAKQYERQLKKMANDLGVIVIAGLDFKKEKNLISNRAIIVVPNRWPHGNGASIETVFSFGKNFAAHREKVYVESHGDEWSPCDKFYILDLKQYGRVGLAICADFYDIERYALYKGRIQHLFILAFNQDIKSFYFLAESISRLVYCNVVICNTGYYGGSVCFTPAVDDYKRYCYKHEGKELFTSQIVKIPVDSLWKAQNRDMNAKKNYKSPPPGYKYHYTKEYEEYVTSQKNENV